MTYQIKTPLLKTVSTGLLGVFKAACTGEADVKQGQLAVSAGGQIRRSVETDLRLRLNAKRLEEIENVTPPTATAVAAR